MGLAKDGGLDVEHCDKDGHEPSHGHRRHQLPVRVEWVEGQGALSQMYKTLKKHQFSSFMSPYIYLNTCATLTMKRLLESLA